MNKKKEESTDIVVMKKVSLVEEAQVWLNHDECCFSEQEENVNFNTEQKKTI